MTRLHFARNQVKLINFGAQLFCTESINAPRNKVSPNKVTNAQNGVSQVNHGRLNAVNATTDFAQNLTKTLNID